MVESCKNLKCDNDELLPGEENEKSDNDKFEDCVEHLDDDYIDEVYLKDLEINYTEEQLQVSFEIS